MPRDLAETSGLSRGETSAGVATVQASTISALLNYRWGQSMSQQTSWRSYEEVARYLLDQMAGHFGLGRVEGKQLVPGASTEWEIDAKGITENNEGFVVIECRRYTTQGVSQGQMGGLVFQIQDTGAERGILVSPLPPQSGAQKVAASHNIQHVRLSSDSTTTDYVLQFLKKTFYGASVSEKLDAQDTSDATVTRGSGTD